MRSTFLPLVLVIVPLLAPIGCTEEFVASGGSGGGTASTTTGGSGGATETTTTTSSSSTCAPLNGSECDMCLAASCSEPYCACAGDTECVDLFKCMEGAQSQEEVEKCAFDHPNSIARAGRAFTCGSKHCAVCQIPPVTECAACEYDKCAPEIDGCLGSEACVHYYNCLKMCASADQGCKTACYNAYPEGANPLQQLVTCASGKCTVPCAAPQ